MAIFSKILGSLKKSEPVPHCYVCAKLGHHREMVLVANSRVVNLQNWSLPWSPTQGCFQCQACGRLVCYTHSDANMRCDCGACAWVERTYLQKELDNEY